MSTDQLRLHAREAAQALGLNPEAFPAELVFTSVSTDTRKITPGSLFVALKGENFDGHDFLAEAYRRGAAGCVIQRSAPLSFKNAFLVSNTLHALGELARWVRLRRPLKVFAITGSNGKTTVKELTKAVLSQRANVLATKGNLNNLVGLPLTLLGLRPEHNVAVLEMGMNAPGEIARLTQIALPDYGLITSIGPAHTQGLHDLAGVARAKGELFSGLGREAICLVNADDPNVRLVASQTRCAQLTYGFNPAATVMGRGFMHRRRHGINFDINSPLGAVNINMRLLGRHNALNALAAAAAGLAGSISLEEIKEALCLARPFPGRLEMVKLNGPIFLVDDTYNANPASMAAALNVLKNIQENGRAIAVLGDMFELGETSQVEHAKLGRLAAGLSLDLLVGVGPLARGMLKAARQAGQEEGRTAWYEDSQAALTALAGALEPQDRVMVKGSRGMRMENVVAGLVEHYGRRE